MDSSFISHKPSPAKNIAIIGGSGFLGTQLATDLWKAGHFVRIIDITPSQTYPDAFHTADVRDKDQLKSSLQGIDTIINLAAAHRDDIRPLSIYHDVNVTGAENICAVARELNINHIIFTSSVAVYGHAKEGADENAPLNPFNPYGETKMLAEQVYTRWQEETPTRTLVTVRPTVIFGPKNRGNVHNLISQIARNKFIMIGDGHNRKSMAYVDNVSAFLVFCLRFEKGQHLFNYIDKPDFSMNELVKTIKTALGRKPAVGARLPRIIGDTAGTILDIVAERTGRNFPISKIRIEKFCSNSVFSSQKMRDAGFVPPHDLSQALNMTIGVEFGHGQKT